MENEKTLEELEAENLKLKTELALIENAKLKARLETKESENEEEASPKIETKPILVSQEKIAKAKESSFLDEQKRRSPLKLAGIIASALVLSVFIGAALQIKIIPWIHEKSGDNPLANLGKASGEITPVNTDLLVYTGQKIESANIDQKGLGVDDTVTTPPGFIFSNGKDADQKKLDIYIDFSNQKSRDFFLINRDTIQTFVESGEVTLNVHSLISGNPYSIYGSEALAEAFASSPNLAWTYLQDLLILTTEGESSNWDADKVVKRMAAKAGEIGIDNIDTESLKNGTFASWLISIGNDTRVAQGVSLPGIYLDDIALDTSTTNLNDSNTFYAFLKGELS